MVTVTTNGHFPIHVGFNDASNGAVSKVRFSVQEAEVGPFVKVKVRQRRLKAFRLKSGGLRHLTNPDAHVFHLYPT